MVKAPFAFDDIRPMCLPGFLRYDGTSARTYVSRVEAMIELLQLGFRARETIFVHQAHLTASMAARFDQQLRYPLDIQAFRGARAHASGTRANAPSPVLASLYFVCQEVRISWLLFLALAPFTGKAEIADPV